MSTSQSKLTAQGQISVPAEIRRTLGIGPGSVLEWKEEGDKIVVQRATRYSFEDIHRAAFAGKKPKRRTLDELKRGVRDRTRARHARD